MNFPKFSNCFVIRKKTTIVVLSGVASPRVGGIKGGGAGPPSILFIYSQSSGFEKWVGGVCFSQKLTSSRSNIPALSTWWPQGWGEGMGVDRAGPDQTGREGLHCGDPKALRGGPGPLLSLLVRKPTTGAEGQSPAVTCRGQSPWSWGDRLWPVPEEVPKQQVRPH